MSIIRQHEVKPIKRNLDLDRATTMEEIDHVLEKDGFFSLIEKCVYLRNYMGILWATTAEEDEDIETDYSLLKESFIDGDWRELSRSTHFID